MAIRTDKQQRPETKIIIDGVHVQKAFYSKTSRNPRWPEMRECVNELMRTVNKNTNNLWSSSPSPNQHTYVDKGKVHFFTAVNDHQQSGEATKYNIQGDFIEPANSVFSMKSEVGRLAEYTIKGRTHFRQVGIDPLITFELLKDLLDGSEIHQIILVSTDTGYVRALKYMEDKYERIIVCRFECSAQRDALSKEFDQFRHGVPNVKVPFEKKKAILIPSTNTKRIGMFDYI